MLLGIVGLNGSGKDSVGNYLEAHHSFGYKDLGQEIRDELKALGKDFKERKEMIALGNERRKEFGPNYWCKRAIESLNSKDIVISSIRNPSEVEEIKSRGGKIIAIFANQRVRFQRMVAREKAGIKSERNLESFEEFKANEDMELENVDHIKQQLLKCILMADYKLDNDGSLEELYAQIESLLGKLKS